MKIKLEMDNGDVLNVAVEEFKIMPASALKPEATTGAILVVRNQFAIAEFKDINITVVPAVEEPTSGPTLVAE